MPESAGPAGDYSRLHIPHTYGREPRPPGDLPRGPASAADGPPPHPGAGAARRPRGDFARGAVRPPRRGHAPLGAGDPNNHHPRGRAASRAAGLGPALAAGGFHAAPERGAD